MGVSGGPKSYPDGLVYLVDPANTNSYSGIGNTIFNIVNSSLGGSLLGGASIDSSNIRTIYFNNSSAYVNGPTNIALTNNFTVSVWFKVNVYNTGAIIGKWFADGSNAHRCWIINTDVPTSSMAIVLSSNGSYTNPTIKRYLLPVSLNEYTNITFTFASGTLRVYKNGSVISPTKSIDGSFSSVYDNATRPIQLGYFFDFSNYYNLCNLGAVKIYNRVLTSTEILQNYNSSRKQYYPEEYNSSSGLILSFDPSNSRSYSGVGITINNLAGAGGTATLINGPVFSALNGGSVAFDGSDDGMIFPSPNFATSDFTMDVWVRLNGYPPTANAAIITNRGTNDNGWLLDINSNKKGRLVFQNDAGTQYIIETIDIINLSQWTNLTAVRSGTTLSFYRNGIFQTSTSFPSNYSINSPIANDYVGRYQSPNGYLNANVSNIKYYNRALSSTEVLQNYNATKNRFIKVLPPVNDASLVLNLDAGSRASYVGVGTSWYDLSGNNLNGTLINGPTFSGTGVSSSIVFDRTNDYVSVADNSLLNTFSAMTLEIIVKYTTTNDQIFVQKWNYSGGSQGYTIELYANEIAAACYTGTNYLRVAVSSYPVNNVYHMVLTLSGTTQTLYINGASVSSNSSGAVPSLTGTALTIGNRSNLTGTYFGGNVYLTKFYNRALTASEILQNFNAYRTRYGI